MTTLSTVNELLISNSLLVWLVSARFFGPMGVEELCVLGVLLLMDVVMMWTELDGA